MTSDLKVEVSKSERDEWLAFDATNYEYETFTTYAKAAAWLLECNDEGISEETQEGLCYIARITHRTSFVETDRRELYHEHTDDCPPDCDEEEWPYDSDWDHVGKIVFVSYSTCTWKWNGLLWWTSCNEGYIYEPKMTYCPSCGRIISEETDR